MTTINTNVNSLNAQRNLAGTANSLATSMSRLSSGLRVNSAKDDAAGLSIAERMNTQTRGSECGHSQLQRRDFIGSNCRRRARGHLQQPPTRA